MVDWGTFDVMGIVSGSTLPASNPNVPRESVTVKVGPRLNQSYIDTINDISHLAVMYSAEAFAVVTGIRIRYVDTGILTKNDMIVLNKLWAVLSFESKFHPENETTINAIRNILGELK